MTWRLRILLLSVSTLLPLIAGEAVVRMTGRYRPYPWPLECSRPDLYTADEAVGYTLWPSLRTTYQYPDDNPRTLRVVSNPQGYRDARDFFAEDDRRRICVLGDSFVFGEGVEAEERFTDRVEQARPGWRLDNMGMPGYGPDLMLRTFEELGTKTKPELVLLCMYTDDFRRVQPHYSGAGFPIPRYRLASDGLESFPYPHNALLDASALATKLRQVLWRVGSYRWDLCDAILSRIHAMTEEHESRLAVVFLPGRDDTSEDLARRDWIERWAERRELPFRDLTEAIRSVPDHGAFIAENWHLNPRGNQIVADELVPLIEGILTKR